jgi:hypothetical protein
MYYQSNLYGVDFTGNGRNRPLMQPEQAQKKSSSIARWLLPDLKADSPLLPSGRAVWSTLRWMWKNDRLTRAAVLDTCKAAAFCVIGLAGGGFMLSDPVLRGGQHPQAFLFALTTGGTGVAAAVKLKESFVFLKRYAAATVFLASARGHVPEAPEPRRWLTRAREVCYLGDKIVSTFNARATPASRDSPCPTAPPPRKTPAPGT